MITIGCNSPRELAIDCFVLGTPRSISRKSAPTHWTDTYVGKLI
jgi:hypothetical protein